MATSSNDNNSSTTSTSVKLSYTVEVDSVSSMQAVSEFMVMASLKAPTYQSTKRAPLDLIAVVDRSGSMVGTKLELVKKTLEFVETQLSEADRLGIVDYGSDVTVSLPLTKMDSIGKKSADAAIRNLLTSGSTNLCGGLAEAVHILRSRTTKNEVASSLLFTDGHANVGPTTDKAIIDAISHPHGNVSHSSYEPMPVQQMPNVAYRNARQQNVQQMPNVQNRLNAPNMPNFQANQNVQQMPNVQIPNIPQMPQMQQQIQQMPPIQHQLPPMSTF